MFNLKINLPLFQDTGRELMPTDIKQYQMFGGEKVSQFYYYHSKMLPSRYCHLLSHLSNNSFLKINIFDYTFTSNIVIVAFIDHFQVIFEKEEVAEMKNFGSPGNNIVIA